jgi:hypothetical protein
MSKESPLSEAEIDAAAEAEIGAAAEAEINAAEEAWQNGAARRPKPKPQVSPV